MDEVEDAGGVEEGNLSDEVGDGFKSVLAQERAELVDSGEEGDAVEEGEAALEEEAGEPEFGGWHADWIIDRDGAKPLSGQTG